MHIIFGEETAKSMAEKYTVLELDRIRLEPMGLPIPTYCVIEGIPLNEIAEMPNYINLHKKLIENYRRKDWNFCEQALGHLHGRWGGTINSFYDEISNRIAKYKEQDPGAEWDGVYEKYNHDSGC